MNVFLAGRVFFSKFNTMPFISSAFGIFKTNVIRKIGGYTKGSLGEDLDLTMRIHKYCMDHMPEYRIRQIRDVVCFTQTPENLKELSKQRIRWGRDLIEVISKTLPMLNIFKYGIISLTLLYYIMYKLLTPLFELFGIVILIIGTLFGVITLKSTLIILGVYWIIMSLASIGVLIVKIILYNDKKYFSKGEIWKLALFCFLDFFGYRQLNSIWNLIAIINPRLKNGGWTLIKRKTF